MGLTLHGQERSGRSGKLEGRGGSEVHDHQGLQQDLDSDHADVSIQSFGIGACTIDKMFKLNGLTKWLKVSNSSQIDC